MKYKPLLCPFIFLVFSSSLACQTLHVLLAVNTKNQNQTFSRICAIDLANMQQRVEEIAKEAGFNLEAHFLVDKDFTSEKIWQKVNQLNFKEEDVFLFYYSGHAACDTSFSDRDTTRVLAFGLNNQDLLYTNILFQSIEAKKARLNLFIVDACGKALNTRRFQGNKGAAENLVYKSLLSACGSIYLFSSACRQLSYGDKNGSLFTNAFLNALDHFIDIGEKNITWETLFQYMRNSTIQKAGEFYRNQHPVMFNMKRDCN